MTPEERLQALGLSLPPAPTPTGLFTPVVLHGDLAFISGHAAIRGSSFVVGTLGADFGVPEGREAARLATLGCLASLRELIGELERVRRFVKVLGMIRTTPDFSEHPAVMDGCSELLLQVFGEDGRHVRAAVGMVSLPYGTAVEIEMIVQVDLAESQTSATSGMSNARPLFPSI